MPHRQGHINLGPGGVEDQPFPNISSSEVPMAPAQLNPTVFGGLEELRRYGMFGEGGINRFQQLAERSSAMRRRKIGLGLKRSFGRRGLRSRSGAFATALANASQGENAAMVESLRGLFYAQEQSKLGGLQGLQDIYQQKDYWYERRRQARLEESLRDEGGGLLDWLPFVASIAAAPFTGGASLAATPATVPSGRGVPGRNPSNRPPARF